MIFMISFNFYLLIASIVIDILKSIRHTIYFTGKDFTLQRFMINEEYVFHLKWVVTLFQNSVVEKRLVDVICGDKTAGKYIIFYFRIDNINKWVLMNPCMQNITCFCKPRKRFEFLAKDTIFEKMLGFSPQPQIVLSNVSSKFDEFFYPKKNWYHLSGNQPICLLSDCQYQLT